MALGALEANFHNYCWLDAEYSLLWSAHERLGPIREHTEGIEALQFLK